MALVQPLVSSEQLECVDSNHGHQFVNRWMDLVQIVWSSLGSIVKGQPPGREHRGLLGNAPPGVSQDVPTPGPSGRRQTANRIYRPGRRSSLPKSMVQPCRDDAVQVERERGRRRHTHIGLLAFGVPFVAVLQKHAGPHRTAGAARRAAVGIGKGHGHRCGSDAVLPKDRRIRR